MFSRFLALAALALAPALSSGGNTTAVAQVTTWSRAARPLPYTANADPALRNTKIPSPNGKYEISCTASADPEAPSCAIVAAEKRTPIDLQVGPEALWAPDSDAVAITHSRGGALGTYQVLIYRPEVDGAHDIATAVRRDLAHRYPACIGSQAGCTAQQRLQMQRDPSWVNVAAIRWIENSDQLLMMAWVPDSSAFGANLGRHQGYLVDTHTGRILRRYSELEFKRRFQKDCGDWGL